MANDDVEIIRPGRGALPTRPPKDSRWVGKCPKCGCEAVFPAKSMVIVYHGDKERSVSVVTGCPMKGCNGTVTAVEKFADEVAEVEARHPQDKPLRYRTPAQVLAERETHSGCCNRYCDNMACECMEEANQYYPKCPECKDSGWTEHPHNGWNRNARRCSRGCPSKCSICGNPNCDNPGGQH